MISVPIATLAKNTMPITELVGKTFQIRNKRVPTPTAEGAFVNALVSRVKASDDQLWVFLSVVGIPFFVLFGLSRSDLFIWTEPFAIDKETVSLLHTAWRLASVLPFDSEEKERQTPSEQAPNCQCGWPTAMGGQCYRCKRTEFDKRWNEEYLPSLRKQEEETPSTTIQEP